MSRQRVTPPPQLGQPGGAVALVAAGIVVLVAVQAVGGILIGCALIAYGVGQLITGQTTAQQPATHANSPFPVSAGLSERRVRERQRERITVERYHRDWPMAG